ncbi:MAG: EAL domain-containing protein [Actinomycetota bacterium]|nr:EAL domain-containing protein [Actinomycetota bacterium]
MTDERVDRAVALQRRLSLHQRVLAALLVALVVAFQLLTVRSYLRLSDATSAFGRNQDTTSIAADAEVNALEAHVRIEQTDLVAARNQVAFLSRQLTTLGTDDLSEDARAGLADAQALTDGLAAQLDELDGAVDARVASAVPDLRRTAAQLSADVGDLHNAIEISYWARQNELNNGRAGQERVLLLVAALTTVTGLALLGSTRRTVRADFDRARELLRRESDERAAAEQERRNTAELLRAVVNHTSDVVIVVGPRGRVLYSTPSARVLLDAGAGRQRPPADLVHGEDRARAIAVFERCLAEPQSTVTVELRLDQRASRRSGLAADGDRHFEATLTNLIDHEAIGGVVVSASEVTERVRHAQTLARHAYRDELTGLANRLRFLTELERHIESRRHAAVLFLDVDRFKVVNDRLGHEAGDELLIVLARRLQAAVREIDLVARLGGDEFTVLLADVADDDLAMRIAADVVASISAPVSLQGLRFNLGGSIGVAVGRDGEVHGDELLRRADSAMYLGKQRGRGRVELFDEARHRQMAEDAAFADDLRRAVEEDELELHYQPIVDATDGELVGTEALLRWRRDDAYVPPSVFITAAEETDLIFALSDWTLRRACGQLRAFQDRFGDSGPYVTVNVSARQLHDGHLPERVRASLETSGARADGLVVELTESAVMEDFEAAIDTLNGLKALGVRLAIDDFGTGYSSLSYLRTLPVDLLKIDRSFLEDVEEVRAARVFESVVKLAQDLGLQVAAEGVETTEQLDFVRAAGCDLLQGYLVAPAGLSDIIVELLDGRMAGAPYPWIAPAWQVPLEPAIA